jgi:hypothetical protein
MKRSRWLWRGREDKVWMAVERARRDRWRSKGWLWRGATKGAGKAAEGEKGQNGGG